MKSEIVFDFDGVICDSAFEAFRIALSAERIIDNAFDPSMDHYYDEFLLKRSSVGPAWNYKFVLAEIFSNKWAPWVCDHEALDFQTRFFAERASAKSENYDNWIAMHRFYKEVEYAIRKAIGHLIILSNKNSDAIDDLLRFNNINNFTIYSMSEMAGFQCKVEFLKSRFSKNVKFIDDHHDIIRTAIAADLNNARFARWGYSSEYIEQHSLNLSQLEEWLYESS